MDTLWVILALSISIRSLRSTVSNGNVLPLRDFLLVVCPLEVVLEPFPVIFSYKNFQEGHFLSQYRRFILIVNVVAFCAGLLLYIQNAYTLFLVRVIQGICVGCYSAITPVIIKELSPSEISGTLGAFNQVFISIGVFFSFCFKYVLEAIADDAKGERIWWMVFGFTLITIVFQTVLLLLVFPF